MSKWFQSEKRSYLLDLQIPDSTGQVPLGQLATLRNLDTKKIVAQLKDAGVTSLYMHARDYPGNCYYNTRVGIKHSGIGDRDLMEEFSRECRKVGMTILFYVYMAQAHEPAGQNYPDRDFAAIDENGNRTTGIEVCMNGPGREYFKALLSEISSNYDFDGFWLDCFGWGSNGKRRILCRCENCKKKYKDDTRKNLPESGDTDGPAYRQYARWMLRQRKLVKKEFNQAIYSANPQLTIVYNAGPNSLGRGSDDFTTFDGEEFVSSEFHYQEGHGALSLQCRRSTAIKPDTPFEIEVYRFFCRFTNMMRANQVRPTQQLFTEMATILANGGFIQYYDQMQMDGTLDERSLEKLKVAFAEVEKREEFIGRNQKRISYASIVLSDSTIRFSSDLTSTKPKEHNKGINGAGYAMLEEKIPFDVISNRSVAAGEFRDAKVLVLPSVNCISDKETEQLRSYVENGGGVVATYRTSMMDELGNPRSNFALAELFGADYLEPLSYTYGFMKFSKKNDVTKNLPLNWPMTVYNKLQIKVDLHNTEDGQGNIVHPFRGNKMGGFPGEDTPYPAMVTRKVGKGRVVYFPQPLGQCCFDYGHPDFRNLLTNAIRWAAGEAPPIEVDCPKTVEVVPWENAAGDAQMIHLVNRTAVGPMRTKGSIIEETIPLHDITIRLPYQVKESILQPEGQTLEVKSTGNGSEILVPKLDTYSIVVAKK